MKGILFGGDSFTWGQGLYFYSNLPKQKYPLNEYTYCRDELTEAHIRYKDVSRWARIVAGHFNTFEVVKYQNGGSEDKTFEFFKNIFSDNIDENNDYKFEYGDIEYIIIQTSQIWRNKFEFIIDDVKESAYMWYDPKLSSNWEKLYKWMIKNNETIDGIVRLHLKIQYERFLKEVTFYEEKGIKVRFFCWETELYDFIKNNEYLNQRFIPLTYMGKTYNTISELHNKNKHLKIKYDVTNFNGLPPIDNHPSKECHQIIAQNIIKKIESELEVNLI
jgi:hypothetical protein